jgi:hypothetical protein
MPEARTVDRVDRRGVSKVALDDGDVGLELEPYGAAVFDWRS